MILDYAFTYILDYLIENIVQIWVLYLLYFLVNNWIGRSKDILPGGGEKSILQKEFI